MKSKHLLLIFYLLQLTLFANATITVTALKTEGITNPQGIDATQPRLSWKTEATSEQNVMQNAYQIIVASSSLKLGKNEGDVWNSGKVSSDAQLWIPFTGKALHTNAAYFWKVKVWTNKGESGWSTIGTWSMGLLNENDWKAQWIGLDKAMPWDSETTWSRLSARYLRKEFKATKSIKRATVHISGLGLYELYINGKQIGDQVLAPSPTDYRKTVFYNTYDVTSLIQQGNNVVGVTLGNGRFYTMRQHYKPYKINTFGYPKLRFNLTIDYTDGSSETVGSNTSWKLNPDGPIRSNNEYDGEKYDARKELKNWNQTGYDDSKWMEAERVGMPDGTLRSQPMAGMKIVDRITPVSITPLGSKFILDLGQNMAGWLRIHVRGNAGDSVKLRFAETLQKDGELYVENLRDARATDLYIMKGDANGEDWAPLFVYHGFRYVEISGLNYTPDKTDFTGEVVSDEMENLGTLVTSDDVLNQILKNAWWGIRSDYKGMPVDCPQRNERQPWLGDRSMGCWGESYLFDNDAMYAKWGEDITDSQRKDGCIPDVAPAFWNYYSDNVTWPSTLPMLCDMTYTQFGNTKPLIENYTTMKKWMEHIRNSYMTTKYIVTRDEYGDWCVPPENLKLIHSRDPKRQTDGALISTAYYYKMLQLMIRFADVQGLKDDSKTYAALAGKVKDGFNQTFFRTDSLFYGNNTATANLLPLAFGMIPKQFEDTICKQIIKTVVANNTPQITTGMIGIQWLLRELSKMGRSDVAYAIAANTKYPSWGYMVDNGATTIWELWNGNTASPKMNSGNHVMLLGDLLPWCYENLGGIKSDYTKTAFKHIILKPNFDIPDLEHIDASYITPYGKVVSKWKKTLMHLDWKVSIPVNTTAEVHLPNGKTEQIGSGSHSYSVDIPQKKGIVVNQFLYEKASFPQCHASTIAETNNGDLVAAFFGGAREGAPDVCIWVCRKEKGSDKWTAPEKAADGVISATERKACWNPVLYQMPEGKLYLFYKVGKKVADWTGYLKTSDDGGKTWSKALQLPDGYLGPVKNKPVEVSGKIISPSSTETGGWKVHFEIAEDGGKKIHYVGPIKASEAVLSQDQVKSANASDDQEGGDNSKQNTIQAIQPSILKYKDGRLQILCRTRNGRLATSWSSDKGETWTPLVLTNLPNNNSGTDAVTLQDGRQLLVYNAVATKPGEKKGPRTPLNIAVSNDGINWKMVLTLEDSPISQYSYPSIIQGKDGRIHVVYTWRREKIKYMEIKL
ncbi:MAG: family 78 glycoside hydrolase catalytic domain [Paludibacter sp.]|nr:family 78 glycoside hydrolase catalytic domain [Paludibacter sp.]